MLINIFQVKKYYLLSQVYLISFRENFEKTNKKVVNQGRKQIYTLIVLKPDV